jgi:hypothetical protein
MPLQDPATAEITGHHPRLGIDPDSDYLDFFTGDLSRPGSRVLNPNGRFRQRHAMQRLLNINQLKPVTGRGNGASSRYTFLSVWHEIRYRRAAWYSANEWRRPTDAVSLRKVHINLT